MQLSIIIVNFNTFGLTCACIQSIQEQVRALTYEIILVDNAPQKNMQSAFLKAFPNLVYLRSEENIGFGRANNMGMAAARGKYLLLINSDTLVIDDSLERCYAYMEQEEAKDIGLLGCKLLNEDHTFQQSFFPFRKNHIFNYLLANNLVLFKLFGAEKRYQEADQILEVGDVSGAFMFLRRAVVEQVGMFDPDFFLYCEETEWCRERIAKKYKIVYYPQARIIHYGGKSAPREPMYVQSKLSLSLLWYKKGWGNYLLYILASYGNVLANALTWPLVKKNIRQLIRNDLKSYYKLFPYLFREVPRYGRGWGMRKTPLIYEGARAIFFENKHTKPLKNTVVPLPVSVCYIISDIDKALAFEWIAQGINRRKVQLSFILLVQQPPALHTFLRTQGVPCTVFYYRSKKDLPLLLGKVYRLLRTQKPDVVHCHLLYGALVGLTAARLARIRKRIYTRHHSDYHHRYFPKGIKWDKWCNRLATHIIAPSGAVKEVLTQMELVPAQKISIIHHGFDIAYFTQVPEARIKALTEKYKISSHRPVIGVIARFTELKGIQYIIPAFGRLLHQYPNALLMLFNARGDYEKELGVLLKELPPSNYRLIPFEQDLAAVYRLFDVFIQASTDKAIEAFGQTYVEALASGVPSVFTLAGIAQDFVQDGNNALVVPFKNSDAIYQALLRLLQSPTLYDQLAINGYRSVVEKFSLNRMLEQLENIYSRH